MRRKRSVLLFSTLVIPILFAVPIFLLYTAPKITLAFELLTYLSPLALLIFLLLPATQGCIEGGSFEKPRLLPWILSIVLIELSAYSLFMGQLDTLRHYVLATSSHPVVGITTSESTLSLLGNKALMPWAFISLAMVIFIRTHQKHASAHHLSAHLPLPENTVSHLVRRFMDIAITIATICFVGAGLGFGAIQISQIIYPKVCVLMMPITGLTTISILLIFVTSRQVQKLLHTAYKLRTRPIKLLLALLIVLVTVIVALSFITYQYLWTQNQSHILAWHSFIFFPKFPYSLIETLFTLGWWIAATPFLSSLIAYFSNGKSIRLTILITLLIPFLLCLLWHSLQQMGSTGSIPPLLINGMQIFALIMLLLLFSHPSSHQALWLGYLPLTPLKKLRIIHPKALWLITLCMMGIFTISGMEGFVLFMSISSFYFVLWYILLLRP